MKSPVFKTLISFLLIALLGGLMAWMSWNKWPDPLVDFGRELYVPWQISEGATLYRDLSYFNGPFSPYLNALLFRLFPSHLMTLVIFNLLLLAVITALIYGFFLRISDPITATAVSLTFLGVFAFSQHTGIGNNNYITPYSHEMTHGILLSFIGLTIWQALMKEAKVSYLFTLGAVNGMVFLTKPEFFVALAGSSGLAGILLCSKKKFSPKEWGRFWGIGAIGFSAPVIFFLFYLSSSLGVQEALKGILTPYQLLSQKELLDNPYYLWTSGFDHPWENLGEMFKNLLEVSLIILLMIFYAIGLGRIRSSRLRLTIYIFSGIVLCLILPILIRKISWLYQVRCLPIVILFSTLYFGYRVIRKKEEPSFEHSFSFFVLSLFSLLLLVKIILKAQVFHYGFALAVPATLLTVALFSDLLPLTIKEKFKNPFPFRVLSLVLIGIFILAHIDISWRAYALKNYTITSSKGTLVTWDPQRLPRGKIIKTTLQELNLRLKPQEGFIVFPEGIMLNFLTARKNPSPFINFMPPELIVFKEERILAAIQKSPPEYILIADKSTEEYGYQYFGKDYGQKIFGWLMKSYQPVTTIGAPPLTGAGFGIQILVRK
jgi:hypothetical protein